MEELKLNYTVLQTEQVHGNLMLDFTKTGNEYLTGLYNKQTKEYTYKKFVRIDDALQCYCYMLTLLAYDFYDEKQKRNLLKNFIAQA